MRDAVLDLRYAARSLRRTPGFTLAAAITLALGIGANSAIFTLLDAVMFKPLGLPDADTLVVLYESPTGPGAPSGTPDTTGGTGRFLRFSYPRFLRLRQALGDMGSLGAMTRTVPFGVRLDREATQSIVRGQLVSGNYFAGVTSAAVSTCGLLANCSQSSSFTIKEQTGVQLNENYVGAAYFTTVGIPLKGGREFTARDVDDAPRVAIVSESVARRYFGGLTAVGQQIGDDEFTAEIVGVVGDTRPLSLRDAPVPMVYFPIAQNNQPIYTLSARVTGDTRATSQAIQQALKSAEPGLVIETTGTMATYVTQATSRERLVTYLVSALGTLSLVLACVGLYGVLSYTVIRRLPELGVRAALGATPAALRNLVLRDAAQMIVAGTLAGLGVAWWANRVIQSQLFGVGVFDPLACAFVIALLATSALAACLLPAAQAARIDPLHALRQE